MNQMHIIATSSIALNLFLLFVIWFQGKQIAAADREVEGLEQRIDDLTMWQRMQWHD